MSYPYKYQSPPPGAKRSPCPALNTLANHGYINRNGEKIKLLELVNAVHNVYNISKGLALFLATTGIILCGTTDDIIKLEVDLDKLAKHNRIEHDFSLVHKDAQKGEIYAPTDVNWDLLRSLLAINNVTGKNPKTYLKEEDFIKHRDNLMGDKKLDKIHKGVASGEICFIMEIMGKTVSVKDKKEKERRVDKVFIESWMGHEKLPEGWTKPNKEMTFKSLSEDQKEYDKVAKELLAENVPKDTLGSIIESLKAIIKRIHGAKVDSSKTPPAEVHA